MAVNKGLGRGLSELFQSTEEEYSKNYGVTQEELKEGVLDIDIDLIYANPNQPRKIFDIDALNELSSSIKLNGVISPIIVNKDNKGKYMIIAGERRYRASKMAGLKSMPALIKDYDERKVKEISLIENLQRENLNPIESANAMKQLMDDYELTQEELADRLGKSRSAITNTLRLLTLSDDVIKQVTNGQLSSGHARALVTLPKEEQTRIANDAVKHDYSVREIEKAVKDYFNPPKPVNKEVKKVVLSNELNALVVRMQQLYKTKVAIMGNEKKGRIFIDYYTPDDLQRIYDMVEIIEENEDKLNNK